MLRRGVFTPLTTSIPNASSKVLPQLQQFNESVDLNTNAILKNLYNSREELCLDLFKDIRLFRDGLEIVRVDNKEGPPLRSFCINLDVWRDTTKRDDPDSSPLHVVLVATFLLFLFIATSSESRQFLASDSDFGDVEETYYVKKYD